VVSSSHQGDWRSGGVGEMCREAIFLEKKCLINGVISSNVLISSFSSLVCTKHPNVQLKRENKRLRMENVGICILKPFGILLYYL
jgi:hypothetical protein